MDFSRLTLGVIGHVDHGKTALVAALTGMDTDRLAEERRRGLSIVLGFAHCTIDGMSVDFIDAPGHQAFIRAMVAGATGFDGVVLAVAANEGIMPQTREHFGIARLLGISRGVIALTKADTVEAAMLEQRIGEVREFVADSFLEDAAIVPVSAPQGEGIDALKQAMRAFPPRATAKESSPAYLPFDRVFTVQGFGVVATGTLRGGPLRRHSAITVVPRGVAASVRGLQVHGADVESACAGQRVAVNLRGLDTAHVGRGDVLSTAREWLPTRLIDAQLEVLGEYPKALRNGARVRLLIGTADVPARIRLLDATEAAPGEQRLAQFRCERDVACVFGEHFIVRTDTPSATIGGGRVLETYADRHRRFDDQVIERLHARARDGIRAVITQRLDNAPEIAVTLASLAAALGISDEAARSTALECRAVEIVGGVFGRGNRLERLCSATLERIEEFHARHPERSGIAKAELAASLRVSTSSPVLDWAIERLVRDGVIAATAGELHVAGSDPLARLDDAERQLAARLLDRARTASLSGLDLTREAAYGEPVRRMLRFLLDSGRLVRLQTADGTRHVALHADVVGAASAAIAKQFPFPAAFAVKDVRDLLQSTRRCIVPLLEHFDAVGLTLRAGDLRRLRVARR